MQFCIIRPGPADNTQTNENLQGRQDDFKIILSSGRESSGSSLPALHTGHMTTNDKEHVTRTTKLKDGSRRTAGAIEQTSTNSSRHSLLLRKFVYRTVVFGPVRRKFGAEFIARVHQKGRQNQNWYERSISSSWGHGVARWLRPFSVVLGAFGLHAA